MVCMQFFCYLQNDLYSILKSQLHKKQNWVWFLHFMIWLMRNYLRLPPQSRYRTVHNDLSKLLFVPLQSIYPHFSPQITLKNLSSIFRSLVFFSFSFLRRSYKCIHTSSALWGRLFYHYAFEFNPCCCKFQ